MYWKIIIFYWSKRTKKTQNSNLILRESNSHVWVCWSSVNDILSVIDEIILFDKTFEIIGRNDVELFVDSFCSILIDWVDEEKFIGNNCAIKLWSHTDILKKFISRYVFDKKIEYLPSNGSKCSK